MTNRFKALSLVLVALAVATTASTASAEIVHDFKSESGPFIITGEQFPTNPIKYEIGEGLELECSVEMLNGTQNSSSPSSITVEPTHEECSANGVPAVVDNEGCRYFFDGTTSANGHAQMHVECSAGNKIRLTLTGCTVEVGEQTPSGGVHYTNTGSGSKREVDMQVTTTNIKYTLIGVLCGAIGGNGSDLSMRGTYTMAGYKDNGGKEGERTGFWTEETVK